MENVVVTHYDTRDYIYPLNRNSLQIKVQCKANVAYSISIVYWNKFINDRKESNLESFCINGPSNFYSIKLPFDEAAKYISYYFVIRGHRETLYYSPYGLTSDVPKKYFEYPNTNEEDVFNVPTWAEGTVGYQIFPERFCNGDLTNDPEAVEKWGELPNRNNFFGGDLRGIIKQFQHIKDLGIGVIYLTPIFHSPSNHKYDTIDYFKIDPAFGTLEDLKELVRLCHSNDMRIVLDGVFNHIGYYSQQFQDVIQNGKNSKYWNWFYIHGEKVDTVTINYECVGYYKWMPKLKFSNPEVREYFLSVGEYWIKEAGIDGWRLDVSDEVDFTFWQEFRRKLKRLNNNTLLIGETWKNGMDLLRGDQMDTIMNYRFRDTVKDYFADRTINIKSFVNRIESILFDYPTATHNVLYNLLDSHDTARFLTTCHGDISKLKLSVVFQMTFPGMPFVYYGDEIGMTGETDPDCRKTMAWDAINSDILEFYKKIISLRNRSNALKYGDFKHIHTIDEVYVFIRKYENETVIVFMNNSEKVYNISSDLLKEGVNLDNLGYFNVDLPACGFEILRLIREGEELKINRFLREFQIKN